jgi:hypothetical protein
MEAQWFACGWLEDGRCSDAVVEEGGTACVHSNARSDSVRSG